MRIIKVSPKDNISDVLKELNDGDTIILSKGTYHLPVLWIKKRLVIKGE